MPTSSATEPESAETLGERHPSAPTILRQLRYQQARYPVNGVKSPADGVIPIAATDFTDGCPSQYTADGGVPTFLYEP